MGITKPTIHVTVDPTWSQNLNDGTDVIDAHNHSPGKGAPIHSEALDVDADISMAGHSLTNNKQVTFSNQTSFPANPFSLYWENGELYANNGAGVPLQITENDGSDIKITELKAEITALSPLVDTEASLTLDPNDGYVFVRVYCNGAAANTINLPFASAVPAGRFYLIKDIAGGANAYFINIHPAGSNTIENVGSDYVINQAHGWAILTSDGVTNWYLTKPGLLIAPTTPSNGWVLQYNSSTNLWTPSLYAIPDAQISSKGIIQLAGDLDGYQTAAAVPRVGHINGTSIPEQSTTSANQVLTVNTPGIGEWKLITNSNVDASAAIEGTKIDADFGTQDVLLKGLRFKSPLLCTKNTDLDGYSNSLIHIDTSDGYFSLQLPDPRFQIGKTLIIKDIAGWLSTYNLTIRRHSTDKINGLAKDKVVSSDWGTWVFTTDSYDWFV